MAISIPMVPYASNKGCREKKMVSLLPTQVLSVPGDVLCGPSQEGASSSGAMPEPKQFAWLSRDIVLPIHICAIKVLPDRDFFEELDALWVHAVNKWLRIFEILGYSGLLGEALASELCLPDGGRSREMVRDSMGIKSPRTAIKRAQTVLKYFAWMKLLLMIGSHGCPLDALIIWQLAIRKGRLQVGVLLCCRRSDSASL